MEKSYGKYSDHDWVHIRRIWEAGGSKKECSFSGVPYESIYAHAKRDKWDATKRRNSQEGKTVESRYKAALLQPQPMLARLPADAKEVLDQMAAAITNLIVIVSTASQIANDALQKSPDMTGASRALVVAKSATEVLSELAKAYQCVKGIPVEPPPPPPIVQMNFNSPGLLPDSVNQQDIIDLMNVIPLEQRQALLGTR